MNLPAVRFVRVRRLPLAIGIWLAVGLGLLAGAHVALEQNPGLLAGREWLFGTVMVLFAAAGLALGMNDAVGNVLTDEGSRAKVLLRQKMPRVGEPFEGSFVLPRGSDSPGPLRISLVCALGEGLEGEEWRWTRHWWRHQDVQPVTNFLGTLEAKFRIKIPPGLPRTGQAGERKRYEWTLEVAQLDGPVAYDFEVEMAAAPGFPDEAP